MARGGERSGRLFSSAVALLARIGTQRGLGVASGGCETLAEHLIAGPASPGLVRVGRLSVAGGGITFEPGDGRSTGRRLTIAAPDLLRVGSEDPSTLPSAAPIHTLAFQGLSASCSVRDAFGGWTVQYAFRVPGREAPALLVALAAERVANGVPAIAIEKGVGGRIASSTPPPARRSATAAERGALPVASLPHQWLRLTAGAPRRRCVYLDGVSMLLELAILGYVDVAEGTLVVPKGVGPNAALIGALSRLVEDDDFPLDVKALHLGAYVGGLGADAVGVGDLRDRVREMIVSRRSPDLRSALLVWMIKQDAIVWRVALPLLFADRMREGRRALRRTSPDLYSAADHETAGRAHRVLHALVIQPYTWHFN
jgi:hypothetical protein